jgi:hypothetical protein
LIENLLEANRLQMNGMQLKKGGCQLLQTCQPAG